ncbi:MAG: hypothetical protein A2Y62_00425 [Candidatus Fischerbacteria bacterium RBG_13_37_8]|uniref:Porin domain-containing protein n=1 Tax=Candidatus Fischerbacteria bacterium RBG_13_37_8 TaxID=1817863 RepID=A0A1F5VVK4_9BACT|nr:MAG: hypothetical protein A2Y62_00425 [Candidatus Fischerbacteria bacterium RBG_13_37_8]
MKRSVYFFCSLLVVIALTTPSLADITLLQSDTHKFIFYGFLKFDAIFQDHAMNSLTAPRYPKPDTPENDFSSTNFTAMNTRFGFKWTGPEIFNGTKINGHFEFDLFDGSSRNQMQVRSRLAFLELRGTHYSIIAGQHWDVFAAGLPLSLLTNGFYWQTGNVGFRRAQIRYTRFFGSSEFAFALSDPTTDAGILSKMPIMQARFSTKIKENANIGISFAYGKEKIGEDNQDEKGVSADFKFPFSGKFTIMGEVTYGQNLKVFLSRASIGQNVLGGWLELVYSSKKIDCYIGFAAELLTDDEHVAASELKDSNAVFFTLIHKLGKGVSYGIEFTRFSGDYKDLGSSSANQLNFAMQYSF